MKATKSNPRMKPCIICNTPTEATVGNRNFSGGIPLCHSHVNDWSDWYRKYYTDHHLGLSKTRNHQWKEIFINFLAKNGVTKLRGVKLDPFIFR